MSTSSLVEGAFPRRSAAFPMFDANAVGLATFFGSPVAGSLLMGWNYRRLGQNGKAVLTVVLATIVTALVVLATWNLTPGATGVLGLVLFIGMQQIAKLVQGPAVSAHVQEGGRLGSKWTAFWLGMAFLVLVFVVAFGYVMATADRDSVKIGSKDKVLYRDGATKDDAQAVGNALKTGGFFTDRGVAVTVSRPGGGRAIAFQMNESGWNDADKAASLEEAGRQMAPVMGGFPIKVRLTDTSDNLKKELLVGRAEFPGNDDVYFEGGVTQAEAQAVGEALKSADYFQGKGVDVFAAKDGGVRTISFVANSKAWTDPEMLKGFEALARATAPALGGLPIQLRLMDNTLVVNKSETLQ